MSGKRWLKRYKVKTKEERLETVAGAVDKCADRLTRARMEHALALATVGEPARYVIGVRGLRELHVGGTRWLWCRGHVVPERFVRGMQADPEDVGHVHMRRLPGSRLSHIPCAKNKGAFPATICELNGAPTRVKYERPYPMEVSIDAWTEGDARSKKRCTACGQRQKAVVLLKRKSGPVKRLAFCHDCAALVGESRRVITDEERE